VAPRYGYIGGGRHLLEQGAVLAGSLSGAKARLLMMAILSFEANPARARDLVRATVPDAIVDPRS
jgi:L-asparaginase/Glu-tRNA(Gln) amidotransferase subunit D